MAIRSRAICDPVAPPLLAAVRAQLAAGERLAWAASPQPEAPAPQSVGASKLEAAAILVGGYATLGSCVMGIVQARWLWLFVPLLLLALGGAIFLVTRAIKARSRAVRAGTIYAFTTRRALIVQIQPKLRVEALALAAISDVLVSDERSEWPSLLLQAPSSLTFQRIPEPQRARAQLLRMMRDPQTAEQEMAAAETYALQMRRLMVRSAPDV